MFSIKPILSAVSLAAVLSLSYSPISYAEPIKEIKQTYQDLSVNANLAMADGKSYADGMVLITHGTLTHKGRSTYNQLQKNLLDQGVSSLAINLSLGLNDRQGEYDCNTPHTHKHSDAINEIDFWVNWLKLQGTKQITLVGHSRGGNQTAWYAAEKDNDLVNKVVLIAPATGSQQSATDYEKKYGVALKTKLTQAKQLIKAGQGNKLMANTDFIYCKKTQVSAAAFNDYYTVKPQFDTPTLLKTATKPTLVVMGTADDIVADLPEKIEPLVTAGKVNSIMLEDADHFFLDFANEDMAAAIAEFIAE